MRKGGAAQANARKRRSDAAEKQKQLEAAGLKKAAKKAEQRLASHQHHEGGEPLWPRSPGKSPAKLRRKKEEDAEEAGRTPT